jgi:hypothetical protein
MNKGNNTIPGKPGLIKFTDKTLQSLFSSGHSPFKINEPVS